MHVTTNEPYIKRRAFIGTVGTLLGFAALAVGMYVAYFVQPTSPQLIMIPWITLALGILLLQVGKFYAVRYASRVDRAIGQALKNLDNRYYLFNFTRNTPVEHLLLTPNAIFVLETRPFFGDVINDGDRWSRPANLHGIFQLFTDGGIGNPGKDAERDVALVQNYLREHVGEEASTVAVLPVIVFTNPRVKLQISNPAVPVVPVGELRTALRTRKEVGRIPPELHRRLVRALQPGGDGPSNALTTTRSSTWQRSQKSTRK